MGRAPCCEKDSVKRGPWTPEEDAKLLACIAQHGTGSWRTLPKKAGLQRCGKSCRLRWTNYLRPDLKHGRFTDNEEQLIVNLHAALGSRWSLIAAQLPGRTDNDVKNYWNTRLKKKLCEMGIDPITHKPISQLLADLAGSMALPKGGEIAEAALGCFKDDMLNVLMRKRPDWQLEGSNIPVAPMPRSTSTGRQSWDMVAAPRTSVSSPKSVLAGPYDTPISDRCDPGSDSRHLQVDAVVQKIKYSLSRAVQTKQVGGDGVSGREEALSHNMAMMRSRFCGGEGPSSAGSLSQVCNQMMGSQGDAQLPKSVLDMLLDSTSSGGVNTAAGRQLPSLSVGRDGELTCRTHGGHWTGSNSGGPGTTLASHLAMPSMSDTPQMFTALLRDPHEHTSSGSQCQESPSHNQIPNNCEVEPWSPSPSGSSCSSTSLAGGDAAGLEKVLSSDVFLWDFSELSSIMS